MFAFKSTTDSSPLYLNSVLQTYVPSWSLRSANERRFILSQTFSLTVPSWCNDLHISIPAAESLPIFKKHISSIFIWPSNSTTLFSNSIVPFRLALNSTPCFLKKTNTSFSNLFVFYLFVLFLFIIQLTKAKKASRSSFLYSFAILSVFFWIYYIIKKRAMCTTLSLPRRVIALALLLVLIASIVYLNDWMNM